MIAVLNWEKIGTTERWQTEASTTTNKNKSFPAL